MIIRYSVLLLAFISTCATFSMDMGEDETLKKMFLKPEIVRRREGLADELTRKPTIDRHLAEKVLRYSIDTGQNDLLQFCLKQSTSELRGQLCKFFMQNKSSNWNHNKNVAAGFAKVRLPSHLSKNLKKSTKTTLDEHEKSVLTIITHGQDLLHNRRKLSREQKALQQKLSETSQLSIEQKTKQETFRTEPNQIPLSSKNNALQPKHTQTPINNIAASPRKPLTVYYRVTILRQENNKKLQNREVEYKRTMIYHQQGQDLKKRTRE